MKKYYIVDSTILPDVIDKVIEARNLLQSGTVKKVSDAVDHVGISRGTFYKYKDFVFEMNEDSSGRKAVISLVLHDKKGILSDVLVIISQANARLLSVNQIEPIGRQTIAIIAFDISEMSVEIEALNNLLAQVPGIASVRLVGIE